MESSTKEVAGSASSAPATKGGAAVGAAATAAADSKASVTKGSIKEKEDDPSRSGKGGGIIRIPEGIMEVARKTPSPPGLTAGERMYNLIQSSGYRGRSRRRRKRKRKNL